MGGSASAAERKRGTKRFLKPYQDPIGTARASTATHGTAWPPSITRLIPMKTGTAAIAPTTSAPIPVWRRGKSIPTANPPAADAAKDGPQVRTGGSHGQKPRSAP